MKESCWKDCLNNNKAINVSINKSKADSLMETAKERIKFFDDNRISSNNSRFIFEGYYSSLIEMIRSIVVSKGIRIENHLCLGFYLRDVLNEKKLFNDFDDCRYVRNSIIYYGKKPDFEIMKEKIEKIKKLIDELYLLSN